MSIPLLAQTIMAMGLGRPDDSRGRPSSLLKKDDEYALIFSDSVPLDVYLWAAKTQKAVDTFLMSAAAAATGPERTNLRFHLAMLVAHELAGERIYAPAQLTKVTEKSTDDADIPELLGRLRSAFAEFCAKTGDSPDKVAKGKDFVKELLT